MTFNVAEPVHINYQSSMNSLTLDSVCTLSTFHWLAIILLTMMMWRWYTGIYIINLASIKRLSHKSAKSCTKNHKFGQNIFIGSPIINSIKCCIWIILYSWWQWQWKWWQFERIALNKVTPPTMCYWRPDKTFITQCFAFHLMVLMILISIMTMSVDVTGSYSGILGRLSEITLLMKFLPPCW